MSESEAESVHVEPIPNYRVKFCDMPKELEECVARSKYSSIVILRPRDIVIKL